MSAYYNEFDPHAAAWLRNLIAAGHIALGDVDERNIEDVHPSDLLGYTQCHFFAGIGVWSYALRCAGWSDDRPVWTGSCPCQPFSAAGKGAGFDDERHLWPAFHHLIKICAPAIVLGEQVASSAIDPWIDLVHADLEALGYASSKGLDKRGRLTGIFGGPRGAVARQAAVGAGIHAVRLADADLTGAARFRPDGGPRTAAPGIRGRSSDCSEFGGLADSDGSGFGARLQGCAPMGYGQAAESDSSAVGLGDALSPRRQPKSNVPRCDGARMESAGGIAQQFGENGSDVGGASPTNGFWRDADWLGCRDGKWRPVEPGTFPLADGATNRVGRLRAYGNAINAKAAQAWIETLMEYLP